MIELFLNAVKLVLSKEARDAGSDLLDLIHRSPEWKKDLCTLKLRLGPESQELADLIRDITVEKMGNLEYATEAVGAYQTCFVELVENVFEHGCRGLDKCKVEIAVNITKTYIALVVTNPKNRPFDPVRTSRDRHRALGRDSFLVRGRGLLTVRELADTFAGTADKSRVKVVIFRDRVVLEVERFESVVVVKLRAGLFNQSCPRRLENEALRHLDADVILDLSDWEFEESTRVIIKVLSLQRIFESSDSQLIALRAPSHSRVSLPTYRCRRFIGCSAEAGRSSGP